MCGIFGIAARRGCSPSLNNAQVVRLRDLMSHRGPDGAGLWRRESIVLAHRRLAILDLSDAGAQPMLSDTERHALVYNGELYNCDELRSAIRAADRRPFQSHCDSEVVLRALELWGADALKKFRGMFALAWWDAQRQRLTLARDPLGIKPLYFAQCGDEVRFASEPRPLLEHPDFSVRPNLAAISGYLTTIRTTLGSATLFEDVRIIEPGERVEFDLSSDTVKESREFFWRSPAAAEVSLTPEDTRLVIEESVAAHLQSDVPVCALLSGGLDSAITTSVARERIANLRTYCAGAPSKAEDDDLACARRVADELGVRHDRAVVTRDLFARRWPQMVRAMGTPLSTPNEVAINTVAERLRADDCVVTISGEGADELFAGYEAPILATWQFVRVEHSFMAGGRFQLELSAWTAPQAKSALLREHVWSAVHQDEALFDAYDNIFARCASEAGPLADPVEIHLRFLQSVNLVGLLQRLDSATMLASVEGRTPFADVRVAEFAATCPMQSKFQPSGTGAGDRGGVAVATRTQTKIALRRAFAGRIPQEALERPKASFPLPFEQWLADQTETLRRSAFLREIVRTDVIEQIAASPQEHWRLAWPMTNLAIWGDVWWG